MLVARNKYLTDTMNRIDIKDTSGRIDQMQLIEKGGVKGGN